VQGQCLGVFEHILWKQAAKDARFGTLGLKEFDYFLFGCISCWLSPTRTVLIE
jgi:hypothetical protein